MSPCFNCLCLLCLFTGDVSRLNEKLAETSKVKLELQLKLDNVRSSEASVQVNTPDTNFKAPFVVRSVMNKGFTVTI